MKEPRLEQIKADLAAIRAVRSRGQSTEEERAAAKDAHFRLNAYSDLTYVLKLLGRAESNLKAIRRENNELRDVLGLCDPNGHRLGIRAPEDPMVRALCERTGYGAVMDSAYRQWREKDPVGAKTVGPCVGTVRSVLGLPLQGEVA